MAYKGKPKSAGSSGDISNTIGRGRRERGQLVQEIEAATSLKFAEDADSGSAKIGSLVEQLEGLYQERELIQSHLGISDPHSVLELVQSLEAQLAGFYSSQAEACQQPAHPAKPISHDSLDRLQHIVGKVRLLSAQRDDMESQLIALYTDRETLTQVKAQREDMESQLIALYTDREKLMQELGSADPDVICDNVHSLSLQLSSLYEDRELFLKEFHTGDPTMVIAEQKNVLALIRVLEDDLKMAA